MIDKNELLQTYNESKNKQTQKMKQLRDDYIEPMIDSKLTYAAKNAKTHIEIDIVSIFKATVRNKSNMYIDENIMLNEAKSLIEDYAKIITIENIEDLRYIFVIDKELYDQHKG